MKIRVNAPTTSAVSRWAMGRSMLLPPSSLTGGQVAAFPMLRVTESSHPLHHWAI
jgi:hypothetical protein